MVESKMTSFEKKAVGFTSVNHAMIHVLELAYGALLVDIAREFDASLLVLGVLANIFGFALGAMSLPTGFIVDRMSERRLLMLCCLGMGLSSVAIGLAPNVYVLGAALMLLGLSLGIYHPAGAAFIARVATHRGMGFAFMGVGGSIGIASGPIVAGAIAAFLGWRAPYLLYAIPSLLLAAVFFFFERAEAPVMQQSTSQPGRDKASLWPFIIPLSLIFTAQIMNGFVYRGLVTFLPLYLGQRIQLSLWNLDSVLIASSFTTIALIFGIGGQFLGGYLSERRSPESIAFVIALASVPLLVVMGNSAGMPLLVFSITFAFFHFMGQPVFNCLVADYSPTQWRGLMFGISFFCAFGVGSFSASMLGYVADTLGVNWVFTVSAGFGLIGLACTIILLVRARRTSGRARPE
ncbi:MFS transporter [Chloroflexota bacterium]